ncbi:MAG: hypothetical protein ACOC80_12425 [Petrotogales bacterium]
MKNKKELEQLNDEQEMLEFFIEHHKHDVDNAKMKILHALHDYKDGVKDIFENLTKGMSKKQINEWVEQCEIDEEEDSKWINELDKLKSEIEEPHNCNLWIEPDEYDITIAYWDKFIRVEWRGSMCGDKPKMSEMEDDFVIELTDDAHFLIDLATALIYNHCEDFIE